MDGNNMNDNVNGNVNSSVNGGVQPQQNSYYAGQQPYQPPYQPELEEPVSMMDYLGSLLLFSLVPCVGLIVCIVWAFGKDTKKSKANFCRAYLIVQAIGLVVGIIVFFVVMGIIGSVGYEIMNSMYYY